MSAISNTLPQSVLDAMNPGTTKTKSSVDEAQDRFMKLLITQMQNQDPLNPMDNAQVTSQMAQLSTVTGIDKMNETLQSLIGSYQSSQTLQSANLIGHGVLAPGNKLGLAEDKALMGVEFPEAVDSAEVVIKDAAGNVVQTLSLGKQDAGTVPLLWDGTKADGSKAEEGTYTFDVTALVAGKAVTANELQFGMVTTVTTGQNGVKLNVPGLGALDLSDIRQYL